MATPRKLPPFILTYHSIAVGPPPLCISPARFESDLRLMERAGIEAVSLETIVSPLADGCSPPDNVFVLTFDDGCRDFVDNALPVLKRRRLPSTLFVTASPSRSRLRGGAPGPLIELETLRDLVEMRVTVGAHSVDHEDLTAVESERLESQLETSQSILKECSGQAVRHFAYPFGRHDQRVRKAAAAYFDSACTTRLATVGPTDDPLAVPRLDAYYLGSPLLRLLLLARSPQAYLRIRRGLRRLRGTDR